MSGLTREMSSRLLTSLLVSSLSVVVLFGSHMSGMVLWSLVVPFGLCFGTLVASGTFWSLVASWLVFWYTGSFGWCFGTLWSLVVAFLAGVLVHFGR